MALINIPVPNGPDNKFTVILEGVSYDVRICWNNRDVSWYLSLGLTNNPYKFTSKITTNSNILRPYWAYEETPNGLLVALDLIKQNGRLERDSFETGRFVLVYVTSDSVEALQQAAIDSVDRSGIIRVDLDTRFIVTPDPLSGIPFDGVFVS